MARWYQQEPFLTYLLYRRNSGAEAVEASIKLARMATKKQNIIVVQGSYHGRTFGTMAMTKSKTIYGQGFGPLMVRPDFARGGRERAPDTALVSQPGVFTTPFPYWHQMGVPQSTNVDDLVVKALYEVRHPSTPLWSLHSLLTCTQLELLIKQQTAGEDTACIIIEPVLGEGGYIPAPKGYLEGLRKICDQHKMLLVIDEVQSGFGRTGKYLCVIFSPGPLCVAVPS